jgi:hypothetical protein
MTAHERPEDADALAAEAERALAVAQARHDIALMIPGGALFTAIFWMRQVLLAGELRLRVVKRWRLLRLHVEHEGRILEPCASPGVAAS